MKNTRVLFSVLALFLQAHVFGIYCEEGPIQSILVSIDKETAPAQTSTHIKLRRFGIFELKKIRDLIKYQELQLKHLIETERMENERKRQEMLYEEAERRRIYNEHLLPFQGRSNILKDFNTNRF